MNERLILFLVPVLISGAVLLALVFFKEVSPNGALFGFMVGGVSSWISAWMFSR